MHSNRILVKSPTESETDRLIEGTIREPFLDRKVAHQHGTHHVWPRGRVRRLVLRVPITGHVQEEETLSAGVAAHQGSPPLVEPPIPTCAARPHTAFDFQRVVPRFGDAADECPVPPVAVPS